MEHLLLDICNKRSIQVSVELLNKKISETVKIDYDDVRYGFGHYLSLRSIKLDDFCSACGEDPLIVILDGSKKIAFDIEDTAVLNVNPKKTYDSFKEFYQDIRKADIVRGLTKEKKFRDLYEVDLNQNWLPLVPQSMTNFPQPQITRDFSYGACDPNLSSEAQIPLDRVMTVIQSRNKNQLDSILESFRLPREGTFEEKVKRLTGVQVSLSGLNKNFVTLPARVMGPSEPTANMVFALPCYQRSTLKAQLTTVRLSKHSKQCPILWFVTLHQLWPLIPMLTTRRHSSLMAVGFGILMMR